MRWSMVALSAAVVTLGLSLQAGAQVDPNAAQPGQQIGNLLQQFQDNMNNNGMTMQDLVQQARDQAQQNGGQLDPQAFMQNLQNQGVINQGMLDQIGQLRGQAQQFNQQRQMSSLQQAFGSPDDEWAVLGPRVQRVLDIKSELSMTDSIINQQQRGFGGGRNFGGQNFGGQAAGGAPGAAAAPQTPLAKALADLQTALNDANSADADVAARLAAFRHAHEQVQTDLTKAKQDLLGLLTLRQEAVAIGMDLVN